MRKFFVFIPLLCLCGCWGTHTQATNSASMIEVSAMNYSQNMQKILDAFIQDYRLRAREQADTLTDNALASVTKVVDGKPSANPDTVKALLERKAELYTKIELNVVSMRQKIIDANKDMEHILKYSQALKEYFNQKTNTMELIQSNSGDLINMLDSFIGKKKGD